MSARRNNTFRQRLWNVHVLTQHINSVTIRLLIWGSSMSEKARNKVAVVTGVALWLAGLGISGCGEKDDQKAYDSLQTSLQIGVTCPSAAPNPLVSLPHNIGHHATRFLITCRGKDRLLYPVDIGSVVHTPADMIPIGKPASSYVNLITINYQSPAPDSGGSLIPHAGELEQVTLHTDEIDAIKVDKVPPSYQK